MIQYAKLYGRALELRREGLQNLGGGTNIILADNNRGLTDQILTQVGETDLGCRSPQESIFDNLALGAGPSQAIPEFRKLQNIHSGVFGNDQERGRVQSRG